MNFEPKVFLPKELLRKLTDPLSREELSPPHGTQFVLVDLSRDQLAIPNQLLPVCPVIGLHKAKDKIRDDSVDCYATKNDLSQILASISSRPIPSAILVHVLRQSLHNDIPQHLFWSQSHMVLFKKARIFKNGSVSEMKSFRSVRTPIA